MPNRKSTRPHPQRASQAQRNHIEQERRRLQRAAAVLLALIYASDRGLETEQAADVVSVALELVEAAIGGLDIVALNRETRPDA